MNIRYENGINIQPQHARTHIPIFLGERRDARSYIGKIYVVSYPIHFYIG